MTYLSTFVDHPVFVPYSKSATAATAVSAQSYFVSFVFGLNPEAKLETAVLICVDVLFIVTTRFPNRVFHSFRHIASFKLNHPMAFIEICMSFNHDIGSITINVHGGDNKSVADIESDINYLYGRLCS